MAWGLPDDKINKNKCIHINNIVDIHKQVPKIERVQLDGLVLLQIIKHCNENLPKCVAGTLLGLEAMSEDNILQLEVTYSFASPVFPISNNEEMNINGELNNDNDEYQLEIMNHLRQMNNDINKIGWYQIATPAIKMSFIDLQFQNQKQYGPNAICIIYDPSDLIHNDTTNQVKGFKAYRLTQNFYEQYAKHGNIFTKKDLSESDIRSSNILEEIPIIINNPDLTKCWIDGYNRNNNNLKSIENDSLNLDYSPYLESNLEQLNSLVDDLSQQHSKYQNYERTYNMKKNLYNNWIQKKREENKQRKEKGLEPLTEENPALLSSLRNLTQPSRLESLLLTKQMNLYCKKIDQYSSKSLSNLYISSSLQKENI